MSSTAGGSTGGGTDIVVDSLEVKATPKADNKLNIEVTGVAASASNQKLYYYLLATAYEWDDTTAGATLTNGTKVDELPIVVQESEITKINGTATAYIVVVQYEGDDNAGKATAYKSAALTDPKAITKLTVDATVSADGKLTVDVTETTQDSDRIYYLMTGEVNFAGYNNEMSKELIDGTGGLLQKAGGDYNTWDVQNISAANYVVVVDYSKDANNPVVLAAGCGKVVDMRTTTFD